MTMRQMRASCILLLGTLSVFVWVAGQTNTNEKLRRQLWGAWSLVSIATIRAKGEVIYPFYGKYPEGLLMYDKSGSMSVQILSDPRPTVPAAASREEFLAAPADQKARAVDGYYAYFGTWTIDTSKGTVTHPIERSLYPAQHGVNLVRQLVLEGDRLTLTAKAHEMGEERTRKLVWQRIQTGQHQ